MSDEFPLSPVNEGIQQSGGISIAGTQAVGHGARAYGVAPAEADTAALLRSLRELIGAHRAEVLDPAAADDVLATFAEELAEEPADPGALARMLDRLNRLVVPFGPLAAAIGDIAEAFRAVVGH
ncbi:MAG TPA: hypothetical protein VN961_06110 [Streptosporangiaceae bacterium]|nr:hypothetical protein [Streptosporangiaceae bacterium]